MLSAVNLTMRYGDKILFRNANFQLNPGRHYALVGPNGSGKSTLIKILSGALTPEKGDIFMPASVRLGTLKQDHFLYENETLRNTVLKGKPLLWNAFTQKEKLLQEPNLSEENCHQLAHCEKVIEEQQGYAATSQIGELLEGLGLKANTHTQLLKTLSGGYKLRVLLAQVLFSQPDVLILDEPTNHLDLYSIKWLEDYIRQFSGMALVSSHDRSFLNGIATDMIDLDYEKIKIYPGNYDQFEKSKAWDLEQKEHQLAKQEKKKEDLQEFVDRFRAKATKARQAQSKLKAVEKLESAMEEYSLPPSSRQSPKLEFQMVRPSGIVPLRISGVQKAYGAKKVLENVSFEVNRGEKIAILGPNGIGKSTLLEILAGRILPDAGSFEWGHAAEFAYFPQDHAKEFDKKNTLLDWLCGSLPSVHEQQARQMLAQVLFSGEDVHKTIEVLSGGEAARLILAKMMLAKQNLLIFDEPTNHLDMEAIEALIQSLKNYSGTVLFVSHNRHFVSSLASRIIEINETGIHDFSCSYAEYLEKREVDHLDKTARRGPQTTKESTNKNSYEEQKKQRNLRSQLEKQVKRFEDLCQRLETNMREIDEAMSSEGFYERTSREEQAKFLFEKSRLETELNQALEDWENAHQELGHLEKD
ncbi:ribosomal protection-like ABC-F family protein [Parachlamydia sp. AcF125]|uniref:ribosomal protection-like ABC-F family protein n=1 Tax=Parachlamydia sp. AcF125 TaxID=2795736 RepID=UPI001BCA0A4D|nr:ABC-F family ATP-binding cassette domain-containing protein [Parachlamydia sp. AcF125]MBS4168259.1 putative ABC transporter ATP-binding protein YbiT [Parachlamydia sp. AcF125]